MKSFLMIGQSNMAGRGLLDEVPKLDNKDKYVLKNGLWRPFYEPVNCDRANAGISPAGSFAVLYLDNHPNTQIGFIPCADGGTAIEEWAKGEPLYINAINNAKLAMKSSSLQGILWHQGEANCRHNKIETYQEQLAKIVDDFREDLGINDIPFLIGGLGDFLGTREDFGFERYKTMNEMMKNVAESKINCKFISAENLTSNSDILHFNAVSARTFGKRYYQAFASLKYLNDTKIDVSYNDYNNELTNL